MNESMLQAINMTEIILIVYLLGTILMFFMLGGFGNVKANNLANHVLKNPMQYYRSKRHPLGMDFVLMNDGPFGMIGLRRMAALWYDGENNKVSFRRKLKLDRALKKCKKIERMIRDGKFTPKEQPFATVSVEKDITHIARRIG